MPTKATVDTPYKNSYADKMARGALPIPHKAKPADSISYPCTEKGERLKPLLRVEIEWAYPTSEHAKNFPNGCWVVSEIRADKDGVQRLWKYRAFQSQYCFDFIRANYPDAMFDKIEAEKYYPSLVRK